MNGQWLSVENLSDYLGISKETIYKWLERKSIPAHRVGKLWRFDSSEIDGWIKNGGAANKRSNERSTSSIEKEL